MYSKISLILLFFSLSAFAEHTTQEDGEKFYSKSLGSILELQKGVFKPDEAEYKILPYMKKNSNLFKDKSVLDIGSGSGIIAFYALKLGAKSVVATDIEESSIKTIKLNSAKLNYESLVDARLVNAKKPSAFNIIKDNEQFDVIISNLPYSVSLEIEKNTFWADSGVLGISLLQGLKKHLRPDGVAILLIDNHFYQEILIKYAKNIGLKIESFIPATLTPWQLQILYNSYTKSFAEKNRIDPKIISFDWQKENWQRIKISNDNRQRSQFSGMTVIKAL